MKTRWLIVSNVGLLLTIIIGAWFYSKILPQPVPVDIAVVRASPPIWFWIVLVLGIIVGLGVIWRRFEK